MKSILFFLSIAFVSSIATAQAPSYPPVSPPAIATPSQSSGTPASVTQPVGKGSGLWEWTPYAKYHDTIVEVSTEHGSGTGVLICSAKRRGRWKNQSHLPQQTASQRLPSG